MRPPTLGPLALLASLAIVVVTALGCASCAREDVRVAPVPLEGKATAPVAVEARLTRGTAALTLRFEAPATDVVLGVRGLDGLTLGSVVLPTTAHAFAAGETLSWVAPLASPTGTLAVSVAGVFSGVRRARVVSFGITAAAPAPTSLPSRPTTTAKATDTEAEASVGAVTEDTVRTDQGPLKVLPSGRSR